MMGRLARVAVWMVMMMTVMVEGLVGARGNGGRAVRVLAVVMVMLAVRVAVPTRVSRQVVGVVWDASPIWVMMLLGMPVVVVMVVRPPVSVEAALLQLLLDVWGRGMPVGSGTDKGLYRVLWGQAQRLWVNLLVVAAVWHPIQLLQMVLLFCWAEAGRGGHRTAGCTDGGRGHRALRLKTITLAHRRAL